MLCCPNCYLRIAGVGFRLFNKSFLRSKLVVASIGKSTQLPAYILENDPKGAKIVVAQPRRLAATGLASRVAQERGELQAGRDSVGYVVRGDSAMSLRSRLVFCTTGVLLRQLQNEGALDCVTHSELIQTFCQVLFAWPILMTLVIFIF